MVYKSLVNVRGSPKCSIFSEYYNLNESPKFNKLDKVNFMNQMKFIKNI